MATIAIIDDDIYIGDMLAELLQKNGYAVLRDASGSDPIEAVWGIGFRLADES